MNGRRQVQRERTNRMREAEEKRSTWTRYQMTERRIDESAAVSFSFSQAPPSRIAMSRPRR